MQQLTTPIKSNYDFWDENAFNKGRANKSSPVMVFDWAKAARKIRELNPKIAKMGLDGDFAQTAKIIYENGEVVINDYIRTSSTWATPLLILDRKVFICFYTAPKDTWSNWTESTINILKGKDDEIFN